MSARNSLLACPDCHQPVSRRALNCPACGAPIRALSAQWEKRHPLLRWVALLAIFSVFIVIMLIRQALTR